MRVRKRLLRVGAQRLEVARYRVLPPQEAFELRRKLLREISEKLTRHTGSVDD